MNSVRSQLDDIALYCIVLILITKYTYIHNDEVHWMNTTHLLIYDKGNGGAVDDKITLYMKTRHAFFFFSYFEFL